MDLSPDPRLKTTTLPEVKSDDQISPGLTTLLTDTAYSRACTALQQLGISVKNDADLHWSDLLMSTPGIKWSDASRLLCYYIKKIKTAIESCKPLPTSSELEDQDAPGFPVGILRANVLALEQFAVKYASDRSAIPGDQALAAIPMLSLATHLASNYAGIEFDEDEYKIFRLSSNLLLSFFDLTRIVAEFLPGHFNEIFSSFRKDCLAYLPEVTGRENKKAFWVGMILLRTISEEFREIEDDFRKICKDKSRAADLYLAYKQIYSVAEESDYEAGRGRVQSLLDSDKEEQRKRTKLVLAAGDAAVSVLEFYLENPQIQKLMDKVVKSSLSAAETRSALLAIVDYYNGQFPVLAEIIEFAKDNNHLMPHLLKADVLEVLRSSGDEFCRKLLAFLQKTKDPCCYKAVLTAVSLEDSHKACLMIEGSSFFTTDHQRKVRLITAIETAVEQELPETMTEDLALKMSEKKVAVPKVLESLQRSSFQVNRKERERFDNPALNQAMADFERHGCCSMFYSMVQNNGADSESVKNACRHHKEYQTNTLYLQFLHDPRFRKLYFTLVLPAKEYSLEFEERLKNFTDMSSNPRVEAELFRRWLESRKKEQAETQKIELPDRDKELAVKFKPPPLFGQILLIAPTERVNLDLARLREKIPSLAERDFQIMDAENFDAVSNAIRYLNPRRLVVYFTGSASHSNYLALYARLKNELRANLYEVRGKRQMGDLLEFFNQILEKQWSLPGGFKSI